MLLRVVDASGRVVRTLVDGVRVPGAYRAIFDGRDRSGHPLPSGALFCQLRIGDFEASCKMLLLR